ncbi:MAG: histidine kinase, partial [Sinobacteraceae bacterium]|nr:histidine kinase [Nevskiaceae bacterium]
MSAVLAGCFWTAVALVSVLPELGQRSHWWVALPAALAQWWSWGLLAPVIIAIDQRLPFSSQQVARRVLMHLALAPVFAFVYAYFSACVAAVIGAGTWAQVLDAKLLTHALREMFWSMVVYGLIVGIWEAYHYQQRYLSAELRMERLERNFSEARLNALRTQLDPHFLFNALNTISAQVEREPRLARKMLEHL